METINAESSSSRVRAPAPVRGFAPDDRDAFAAIYGTHAPRLLRIARTRGADAELAREMVQDVFVKALEDPSRYDASRGDPGAWFFTLLRTELGNQRRKQKLRDQVFQTELFPDAAFEAAPLDPQQRCELREHGRRIEAALATLPAPQREAWELHHLRGLTVAEIAAIQGVPVPTAQSRLRLANERVRAALPEENSYGVAPMLLTAGVSIEKIIEELREVIEPLHAPTPEEIAALQRRIDRALDEVGRAPERPWISRKAVRSMLSHGLTATTAATAATVLTLAVTAHRAPAPVVVTTPPTEVHLPLTRPSASSAVRVPRGADDLGQVAVREPAVIVARRSELDESDQLRAASQALRVNPGYALRLARDGLARPRARSYRGEWTLIEVRALRDLDRRDEARDRARAFLASHGDDDLAADIASAAGVVRGA